MSTDRSSAGHPARTLALLWRHHTGGTGAATTRRGPRPGLDVDAVVAAALELTDERGPSGLEALTMRAVAQRLGVSPMSLYTYVPGRAELLDCLVDHVHATRTWREPDGDGWRAAAEAVARDEHDLHLAHPWLVRVSTVRPVLGPGATAAYERGLRAFEGARLDDVERDAALTLLLGFVRECARLHTDALVATTNSGQDPAAWWADVGPALQQAMGPERFPLAARVGQAAGQAHGAAYDAGHAFAFGLPRVLDGIAAHLPGEPGRVTSARPG